MLVKSQASVRDPLGSCLALSDCHATKATTKLLHVMPCWVRTVGKLASMVSNMHLFSGTITIGMTAAIKSSHPIFRMAFDYGVINELNDKLISRESGTQESVTLIYSEIPQCTL